MRVFVYRLIDPSALMAHEGALRAQVFSGTGNRPVEPDFDLSPVSGGFKFFDVGRLWRGVNPGRLPKNLEEAARAAKNYFLAVNHAAAEYRNRRKLSHAEYPDPFPLRSLRHMASQPVFRAAARHADHWVSYWMLHLPGDVPPVAATGPSRNVPVYGAVIEVCLGNDHQVIGVVSSARPCVGRKRVDAFLPDEAPHDHSHNDQGHHESAHDGHGQDEHAHHGRDTPSDGSLLYLMESITEPQTFLTPYYRSDNESDTHPHGISLRPACAYSLIIDIAVEQSDRGARLMAVVMNSEGKLVPLASLKDYRLSWLYASLAELENGDPVVTNSQELHLNRPGIYHVEIAVAHRRTEAHRSTYRTVVVARPTEAVRAGVS